MYLLVCRALLGDTQQTFLSARAQFEKHSSCVIPGLSPTAMETRFSISNVVVCAVTCSLLSSEEKSDRFETKALEG